MSPGITGADYLISLWLGFFLCKMGIYPYILRRIKLENTFQELKVALGT